MPPTEIGRALRELNITWIAAHSPQAEAYASYCTSCEPQTTFCKASPFAEPDTLCFARWVGSGILVQPVVSSFTG